MFMSPKSNLFYQRNMQRLSAKQIEDIREKETRYRERARAKLTWTLEDKVGHSDDDDDDDVAEIFEDLKARMKESKNARRENKICKKQIHDLEDKIKFLNCELRISETGKNQLADELEACREELDGHNKASRDFERRSIRATRSDKDYNKKLEAAVKAERRKHVAELDASRDKIEQLNKALEKLNSDFVMEKNAHVSARMENEHYKKQNGELGKALEQLKSFLVDYKKMEEDTRKLVEASRDYENKKSARVGWEDWTDLTLEGEQW